MIEAEKIEIYLKLSESSYVYYDSKFKWLDPNRILIKYHENKEAKEENILSKKLFVISNNDNVIIKYLDKKD